MGNLTLLRQTYGRLGPRPIALGEPRQDILAKLRVVVRSRKTATTFSKSEPAVSPPAAAVAEGPRDASSGTPAVALRTSVHRGGSA